MSKEFVQLDLTGVTKVLPYRDYYKGRNGLVAKYIAEYLKIPFLDEAEERINDRRIYYVPPVTQIRNDQISKIIEHNSDFYGLLVDDIGHVGKSILHSTISSKTPFFYSSEFAKSVNNLVLPGVTIFSKEDAISGFKELGKSGQKEARLKLSDKSDGHGQFVIRSLDDLLSSLSNIDESYLQKNGAVLEANIYDPKTVSIGFAVIGDDTYSFLALQKNDIAPEDGRNRYMGANVRVIKGDILGLYQIKSGTIEDEAIEKVIKFFERYKSLNPVASRLSFDFLYGSDIKGNSLSGITDITGRLGGTCPALVIAAKEFQNNPKLQVVKSEVSLNYSPENILDSERDAIKFIDLPSLRLSAKINEKI